MQRNISSDPFRLDIVVKWFYDGRKRKAHRCLQGVPPLIIFCFSKKKLVDQRLSLRSVTRIKCEGEREKKQESVEQKNKEKKGNSSSTENEAQE